MFALVRKKFPNPVKGASVYTVVERNRSLIAVHKVEQSYQARYNRSQARTSGHF